MQKPGIFDYDKGPRQTTTQSNQRPGDNSNIDVTERSQSPYRSQQQVTQNQHEQQYQDSLNQNQPYNQNDQKNMSDNTQHGSQAVFQDFLQSEFKIQVEVFKNEMEKIMEESLRELKDRTVRNQETINAIKDSIRNNRSNLEELDRKIEEYHVNLDAVSGLIQSEIQHIKKSLPNEQNLTNEEKAKIEDNIKNYNQQKLQIVEKQQQSIMATFSSLKDDIEKSIQTQIDQFTDTNNNNPPSESDSKMSRILSEITQNMEQKINKVLDHLNGKVAVLEKQVQNYSRYDDPIVEKIKFEIDDKLIEHETYYKSQFDNLKVMLQSKVDSDSVNNFLSNVEISNKMDYTKSELESIKFELNAAKDQVKQQYSNIINYSTSLYFYVFIADL